MKLNKNRRCDVLVIGSGAGGMVSALSAHDLGLETILIEKSDRFGGTSAISGGGIWIPNNPAIAEQDTPALALEYLSSTTKGKVPQAKLQAYVEHAPRVVQKLGHWNVGYFSVPGYADYMPWLPGALATGGRTMMPLPFDARVLGDELFKMREPHPTHKVLGRMQIDLAEMGPLIRRTGGWWLTAAKLFFRYWLDLPFRLKSRRDRRLTTGNAMIGALRKAMIDRDIPLLLQTRLVRFVEEDGRVAGAVVSTHGEHYEIRADRGVIVASGGFEKNQALRDRYLLRSSPVDYSLTPGQNNTGDALIAAQAIGADSEFLEQAWWVPTMRTPAPGYNNADMRAALFMERGYPHTMCVNRRGERFVNEAISYNDFGAAMIADDEKTGANLPCWMIFDATARWRYPIGSLMPPVILPDWKVPGEWWDNVVYKAGSIEGLAGKIGVDPAALRANVQRMNGFATVGRDEDFRRGENAYDMVFGDPRNSPNPCLGPIEKAPFYAIPLDIGDIGTKGGIKVDEYGRALRIDGSPIEGLYATGNVAGAMTYDSYPGAGGTLGPAMTFGMVAGEHIAQRFGNQRGLTDAS
jgi:3-oxosteroid 1-dehydrogenase